MQRLAQAAEGGEKACERVGGLSVVPERIVVLPEILGVLTYRLKARVESGSRQKQLASSARSLV